MDMHGSLINFAFPLFLLLIPCLLVFAIFILRKHENTRDGIILFVSLLLSFLSIYNVIFVKSKAYFFWDNLQLLKNVNFSLRIDSAGSIFFIVISVLWFLTTFYSIGYMRSLKEHSQTRFYIFFSLSIFASIGVAFSQNLLTLFIFYEILSFSTYPLVTHNQNKESLISGRKYLGFILGGSIGLVLPAMIYIYLRTGTLDFVGGGIFSEKFLPIETFILCLMFLFGFAKSAVMPMHVWLPNAMVAPTPVSALLHAVAVVKVGVFSLYRVIVFIFGIDFLSSQKILGININIIFAVMVSITILIGSLMAISQNNLKKRLAYSTVSQLSYILLGFFMLKPLAIMGGLFYLVVHAFSKITLFYCAGAVLVATGKKNLDEIRGLGYKMPITFICFFIATLSLVGIPPSGGFLGKFMLLEGVFGTNGIWFVVVYLVSSLLAGLYLFPVIFEAFKRPLENSCEISKQKANEVSIFCLLPIIVTALFSLFLFFSPDFFIELASNAVKEANVNFFLG